MSIDWSEIKDAIAYKFGKEAVLDPRDKWDGEKARRFKEGAIRLAERVALRQLKEEKIDTESGFLLSKSLLTKEDCDRECKNCGKFSFNPIDDLYMSRYECCKICYIKNIEGREDGKEDNQDKEE